MNEIWTTRELRNRGFSDAELARQLRAGAVRRIRRGAYEVLTPDDRVAQRRTEDEHRRLIVATVPQLGPGAVLSHGSAAVLHQLPIWRTAVERVHITRDRSDGARVRTSVAVHGATLPAGDVVIIDGVAVTSMARTVLDLARTLPWEQAVAAGDRALAKGLPPVTLAQCLARMERWPGTRQARRVVGFLDPRSESPGESVSRVRFVEEGLPAPQPQYVIVDWRGKQIARSDFGWEELRTVAEFDGQVKYGRLLRPGQSIADVVSEEKQREDAIRDEGWQVVRWVWADLYRPNVIGDRLRRAFARAA